MERIVYADYLRVIGILGVIGVHLSGDYLSKTALFSGIWLQGVLYSSLTRSGVLLFIMVSGLLLLDRPQSIDKIPHRIERVMTPFIFWILIYLLKYVFIDKTIAVTSAYEFLVQFVNCILNPSIISEEFWYIYMIIGFYLMLPILYKWISNTPEKEIKYFLIVWFIILTLSYLNVDIMLLKYVNLFTGHLGFFILGYYLNKTDSKYSNSILLGAILFILGTLIIFLSIYIPTLMSNQLNLNYIGIKNLAPGHVLKAMGIFLIVKNIDFKNVFGSRTESVNSIILKFAEISYGLYLIHLLVPIRMIYNVNISPFINVPILIAIIVIVVSALLLIMNRIPILKKFTGMKN